MLKLLRKYNKWILVIGGSLLMVAFLAPGAIQNCAFNPRKRTYAYVDGRKVSLQEFDLARRQFAAIEDIFPSIVNANIINPEDKINHWLLLTHAADKGGFVGESADGYEWASGELTNMMARAMVEQRWLAEEAFNSPQFLRYVLMQQDKRMQFATEVNQTWQALSQNFEKVHDQIASSARLRPNEFDQGLSKTRGIYRMYEAFLSAANSSSQRALRYSEEQRVGGYVDSAFVPAAAIVDQIPEPTEEQIAEQFETYKDDRPGEGEYGVGYRLPARVKLEYLTLNRRDIRLSIDLDPIDVNKRWMQSRAEFPGEFPDERRRVEALMINEIIEAVYSLAHEAVQREILKVTSRLEEVDDYKVLPDNWAEIRPTLAAIAPVIVEHVREGTKGEPIKNSDAGLTIPLPEVTVRAADYLDRLALSRITGLGVANAKVGPREFAFPDLALSVKELGRPSLDIPVQLDVPVTEIRLEDPSRSRYYVTILDARDESAPDSVDEIREQVVTDFKEIQAYALLAQRVDEFEAAANEGGLEAVSAMFEPEAPETPEAEDDAEEPTPPAPLNPVQTRKRIELGEFSTSAPGTELDTDPVREALLPIIDSLDPLLPIDQKPIEARTVIVPVPVKRGVVVAQVVGLNPLTLEQYRGLSQDDVQSALSAEFAATESEREDLPFSLASLKRRLGFRFADRDADEQPAESDEKAEVPDAG